MIYRLALLSVVACMGASTALGGERSVAFSMDPEFLEPPPGMATIGDSHGDIAVSPAGEIYVSVQGGLHPGIQIYSAQGQYLRNVPNAPDDFHGFIIAAASDGIPNIVGASLLGQKIIRMTLDGKINLVIPASAIPDQYKSRRDSNLSLSLTGIAVAPNGDIYAVDGYGRDFIHRFDKSGQYLATFGGGSEPWNFTTCHKIAVDSRFVPARLVCADRSHGRLVHMDLNGQVLGVFAEGLDLPGAVAVFKDWLAVAELGGRVTILGVKGEVIASIGSNRKADEIKTNEVPPEKWQQHLFYAPHGVTFDASGNFLVTEWSEWGRVVRVSRSGE